MSYIKKKKTSRISSFVCDYVLLGSEPFMITFLERSKFILSTFWTETLLKVLRVHVQLK